MAPFLLIVVGALALLAAVVALPFLLLSAGWRLFLGWWRRRKGLPVWPSLPFELFDAPEPIVIAVHGTWASVAEGKAAWAMAGSRMHKAVVEAIGSGAGGVRAAWYAFNWTGDNSAAERGAAVQALAALVQHLTTKHPDRFVLLIGHSHGGNIAATVAQRFPKAPRVRVVTLATPFLTVLDRHGTSNLGEQLLFLPAAAFLLATLLVTRLALQWPWPITALASAGALVFGSLLAVSTRRRRTELLKGLRATTLDPMQLEAIRKQTFIVSRIGDEADGSLKLTAFAVNWVVKTMGNLAAGGSRPSRREIGGWLWEFWRSRSTTLVDFAALLLGQGLLSLLQLVAGTSSAMGSVALNVGSSETPPGVWNHLQSSWSGQTDASLLSHSQIYDDLVVIEAVAAWVKAEAAIAHIPPGGRGLVQE